MKTQNLLVAFALAGLLAGCGSLAPARKEFFQDKVERVPERTAKEREIEKQTVDLLRRRTQETVVAAVTENASPAVVEPAKDAAILADAVAVSVGPPKSPIENETPKPGVQDTVARDAAETLLKSVAKLDARLENFREEVRSNEGRKIEGSGLFSVPYFVWLGGVLVLVFIGFILLSIGWMALKAFAISNPPLAIATGAVSLGGKFAKKAFSEVLEGGEKFKEAIDQRIEDSNVKQKVLDLFREHQERAQSPETKEVIKTLTK